MHSIAKKLAAHFSQGEWVKGLRQIAARDKIGMYDRCGRSAGSNQMLFAGCWKKLIK